jgi:hypothetical protein
VKRGCPWEVPHFSGYRIDSIPVINTQYGKPELDKDAIVRSTSGIGIGRLLDIIQTEGQEI